MGINSLNADDLNPKSEYQYLLPPISSVTEGSTNYEVDTKDLEWWDLFVDLEKCKKKKDFQGAAEIYTRMIELAKKHPTFPEEVENMRVARAGAYIQAGNLDAALKDLEEAESHIELAEAHDMEFIRGMIEQMQGKESTALKHAADRGVPLALLLLNDKESTVPAKTEWLGLPFETRVQKLIAARNYTDVIEEISKMDSYPYPEPRWLVLRATCYALRGNYSQAVRDLTEADERFIPKYFNELAYVYSMAGQNEDARKVLKKNNSPFQDTVTTFTQLLLEKKIPAPVVPSCPQAYIDAAKEKIAAFLKGINLQFDAEKLQFHKSTYCKWPDSSLGHPVPGESYAQVVTPGFTIQFKYENGLFTIHTDEKGSRFVMPANVELL